MNLTEYAKHRGVSKPMVSKMIKQGLIKEACKKIGNRYEINQKKADKLLQGRTISTVEKNKIVKQEGFEKLTLTEARTEKERYLAALRKLEYDQKAGELVSKAQIEKEAFDTARRVRDALLSLPDRISAQLAAMADRDQIQTLLAKEIRHTLIGLAE